MPWTFTFKLLIAKRGTLNRERKKKKERGSGARGREKEITREGSKNREGSRQADNNNFGVKRSILSSEKGKKESEGGIG